MAECVKKAMEQTLREEGELLTTASGTSMLPCIRAKKDVLHLVRSTKPTALYDVILYRRKDGTQILHRVLGIENSGYALCGDNQYILEHGIKDSQVLGVLQGFYRGCRYVDCRTDQGYRIYTKIWCCSLRLRKILLWLMHTAKKVWRRFRWKKKI